MLSCTTAFTSGIQCQYCVYQQAQFVITTGFYKQCSRWSLLLLLLVECTLLMCKLDLQLIITWRCICNSVSVFFVCDVSVLKCDEAVQAIRCRSFSSYQFIAVHCCTWHFSSWILKYAGHLVFSVCRLNWIGGPIYSGFLSGSLMEASIVDAWACILVAYPCVVLHCISKWSVWLFVYCPWCVIGTTTEYSYIT